MSHQPKISVIVAVYKAESYIHRCLDSIRNQTFTDFEVLLIDDGSPDRSGEICEEYSRMDSRFLTFHQENKGVGAVRHFGIKQAKGVYSIHIDPDDWIEPDMFELMYNKITGSNTKICMCNIFLEYPNKSTLRFSPNSKIFNSADSYNLTYKEKIAGGLCNKLIETNSIKDKNIPLITDLRAYEDACIILMLFKDINKYCSVEKGLYHYDQHTNNNSLSRNYLDLNYKEAVIKYFKTALTSEIYNENHQLFDEILVGYANEDSLIDDMDRTEFNSVYMRFFKQIILSRTPLRRKINIISMFIGTQKITRGIYVLIRYLYRKTINKDYNEH